MAGNQMLTVRIPEEDLEKLDQLAAVQGRPRSQLVQQALAELISKSENLRDLEFARLKKRLKPAIVYWKSSRMCSKTPIERSTYLSSVSVH